MTPAVVSRVSSFFSFAMHVSLSSRRNHSSVRSMNCIPCHFFHSCLSHNFFCSCAFKRYLPPSDVTCNSPYVRVSLYLYSVFLSCGPCLYCQWFAAGTPVWGPADLSITLHRGLTDLSAPLHRGLVRIVCLSITLRRDVAHLAASLQRGLKYLTAPLQRGGASRRYLMAPWGQETQVNIAMVFLK